MPNKLNYDSISINTAINNFMQPGVGKRGPFYNGQMQHKLDLAYPYTFRHAIWQAYLDVNRTCSGINSQNTEAFCNLSKSIQRYFAGEETFSHCKWCEDLISDFNKTNHYNLSFGQAQKIVNMAFKYLLCCDTEHNYTEKFNVCHMPLDKYTLAWFFLQSGVYYVNWSYIDKTTYYEIQAQISNILKGDVLRKEFVIWEEMKKRFICLKPQRPRRS